MRLARYIAALVALATVGFAVGDFASHPNATGAIGIALVIMVFALLLAYLFRPRGDRAKPAPPPEPERPRRKRNEHVWAEGWNAEEAQAARERRRN